MKTLVVGGTEVGLKRILEGVRKAGDHVVQSFATPSEAIEHLTDHELVIVEFPNELTERTAEYKALVEHLDEKKINCCIFLIFEKKDDAAVLDLGRWFFGGRPAGKFKRVCMSKVPAEQGHLVDEWVRTGFKEFEKK